MNSFTPVISWAQNKENVFLTVSLPYVTENEVKLTDNSLVLNMEHNNKNFYFELQLSGKVSDDIKYRPNGRNTMLVLSKEDKDVDFWNRLAENNETYKNFIKIDWDRWIDEDEEDDEDMGGMGGMPGGMDMAQMQSMMGGMGGMPGMDGGMGGMDMAKMQEMMKGMGGEEGKEGSGDESNENDSGESSEGDNSEASSNENDIKDINEESENTPDTNIVENTT